MIYSVPADQKNSRVNLMNQRLFSDWMEHDNINAA